MRTSRPSMVSSSAGSVRAMWSDSLGAALHELQRRGRPLWILERESGLEKTSRYHSTTLEHKLGLGPHRPCADREHPTRCGQPDRDAHRAPKVAHEVRVRQ